MSFTPGAVELFNACIKLGVGIVSGCHDAVQRGSAQSCDESKVSVGHCIACASPGVVRELSLNDALQALHEDAQIYRLYPAVIGDCFAPYSEAPKEIWPKSEGHWASSAHHACLCSILRFLTVVDPEGAEEHAQQLLREDQTGPPSEQYCATFFPECPLSPDKIERAISRLRLLPSFGDYAEEMLSWLAIELGRGNHSTNASGRLYVDDIDSFKQVRDVDHAMVAAFLTNGFLNRKEDEVQIALEQILGVSFHRKDWGGEVTDLYTANVVVSGTRRATAFLLKGPGIGKKELTIAKCGKNGDQLVRLFTTPAEVFVVQYVGPIADAVIKDVEGKAAELRSQGKTAQILIIDGQDTARLLHAYDKLPSQAGN